jgi:hypothetical protein
MTFAERFSAKAFEGYHCNLEPVGKFDGEGAYNSMAVLDSCGYFSTVGNPAQHHRGVVVVDASDRWRLRALAYLDSPAMARPNESLDAHPGRKLLGAVECPPAVSCTATARTSKRHAGRFSPDGRTYYATSWDSRPSDLNGLVAIDVTDPAKPTVTYRWRAPKDVPPHDIAQAPVPVMIKGRPYIMSSDWSGPGGGGGQATRAACAQGVPPFGFARFTDISDERNPKLVSKILLQVNDPANCTQVLTDLAPQSDYSAYPCLPDDPQNATMVACGWKTDLFAGR